MFIICDLLLMVQFFQSTFLNRAFHIDDLLHRLLSTNFICSIFGLTRTAELKWYYAVRTGRYFHISGLRSQDMAVLISLCDPYFLQ